MRTRQGFTLAEILVVTVILSLVMMGLNGLYVRQSRFGLWGQRVTASHDAFRVANAVLAAELREARPGDGDVVLASADSIVLRSPVGFAVVCGLRTSPAVLGLNRTMGRMPASGDSLLVHADTGWVMMAPTATETPGARSVTCAHGGTLPTVQYRFPNRAVDAVSVGAPIRVFQRHAYHALSDVTGLWLGRTDPDGTEKLVGPLAPGGIRFRFLDADGAATADPVRAVAVELRLIMPLVASTRPGAASLDTLTAAFGGRNR